MADTRLKDESKLMHTSSVFQTVKPLILASGSPRRKKYFEDLGLVFSIRTADVDEIMQIGETPDAFVRRMAEEKAQPVMEKFPRSWVVAADTVVYFPGSVLGKPGNENEAVDMLMHLSGRTHFVKIIQKDMP